MEDKTDYLNFIDRIDTPTTRDFFDYFRIFTLLLQEEADKRRWEGVKAENVTAYDNSSFHNTDLGSKIEYCYPNFKYEVGCRFTISESIGCFSLFFILCPLWEKAAKCIVSKDIDELESDIYYDCGMCKERVICNSIYQATEIIINYIEEKYPNCVRVYDEEEEPIGVKIKIVGDYKDIFIQTCKYLDIIIPVLIKERPRETIESSGTMISFTPTELFDAFLPSSFSPTPHFKAFERESETIEEICSEIYEEENEYLGEEPPF